MGATARRAIKGYTYQQSVFALFLSIMDTERSIAKITVEALNTKNFDDIYLECVSDGEVPGKTYRIQAKNYPDTTIEDISITEHILSIKGNDNEFSPSDNNILIVNTTQRQKSTGFDIKPVDSLLYIKVKQNIIKSC